MKLEGTVEHVIYENADSGYAVFEVDAGGTDVVVAGNVGGVDNGMSVTVYGHMVNHPSYGEQFRAETIEARLPEDRTAILSYLSSGVLPYIGPSTAKKIVAKFGDDTLTVIAETPQRLCELKGITEQKAAIISNEFRRMYGVREVVAWFARYGMTAQQAVTCYRALGPHTVEALTQNPYLLCGEPLQLKFGQVDTIAAALQFETGCRLRVAAGLLYALRHNAGNGHTCLPRDKLLESTSKFLRLPLGDLEATLDELLSSEELCTRTFDGVEYIYLPDLLSAEEDIAARLGQLSTFPTEAPPTLDADICSTRCGTTRATATPACRGINCLNLRRNFYACRWETWKPRSTSCSPPRSCAPARLTASSTSTCPTCSPPRRTLPRGSASFRRSPPRPRRRWTRTSACWKWRRALRTRRCSGRPYAWRCPAGSWC